MLTKPQRAWLERVSKTKPLLPGGDADGDGEKNLDVKAKLEKRLDRLKPALEMLDSSIQANKFKHAPAPLLASVKAYNQAKTSVAEAQVKKRYTRANQAMDGLETAVTQLAAKATDRLKRDTDENLAFDLRKRYMNRQAEVTSKISEIFARNTETPFAQQGQAMSDAWTDFSGANGRRAQAADQKDYQRAFDALEDQITAMDLLDPPPGPLDRAEARRITLQTQADRLKGGIDGGTYAALATEGQQFLAVRLPRLQAAQSAIALGDHATAETELDALELAIQTFRTATAGALATSANASKSGGLKAAKASLQHDPNALRVLMAQPGGGDAIDRMMESIGKSAKSAEDKAFVTAAILARYNMTALSGDMTTKALPRFYEVLGQVPGAQTFGNDKLQFIKRDRNATFKPSTYGDLTLDLNIGKTGTSKYGLDQDDDVDTNAKLNAKNVNKFNHTTLHELGHSVDDDEKFMDGRGATASYGGWQVHKVDQIADVGGNQKGFYAAYEGPTMPRAFLRELLKLTLGGVPWGQLSGDPKVLTRDDRLVQAKPSAAALLAHPALQQAQTDRDRLLKDPNGWDARLAGDLKNDLRSRVTMADAHFKMICAALELIMVDQMKAKDAVAHVLDQLVVRPADAPPIDYATMQNHAAVAWCTSVRAVPSDVWERYTSNPTGFQVGDRVYYQDRNNWRSYAVSARKKSVSQYQFKAPAEWFAELYAAYHMGTLSDSHPDHGWLEAEFGHPQA